MGLTPLSRDTDSLEPSKSGTDPAYRALLAVRTQAVATGGGWTIPADVFEKVRAALEGDPLDPGCVTVTLSREDMQRVYELAVARAVSIEGAETEARYGFGSQGFRRPADAIKVALADA